MGFEPGTTETPASAPAPAPPASTATGPVPDEETGLLVDPQELESFAKIGKQIEKAMKAADAVPKEIGDQAAANEVADALQWIKHCRQDVASAIKDEQRPYTLTSKRIKAVFEERLSPLGAREESLKDRLVAFEDQKEKAAAEERKREERNARERQKREDEKVAKTGVSGKHHAPAPVHAPPKGARGQSGAKSSVRKVTKYEVVDVNKLPEGYYKKEPLKAQIKAAVEQGLVIEGVRVWQEPVVSTR